jgi:hypothetical protein
MAMRIILYIAGSIFALFVLLFIAQIAASERVEVVELHTQDEGGEVKTTRLWIVDHDGLEYLRAGVDSGWYQRATANETVSLTRGESTDIFKAVPRPGLRVEINDAMQEKYTWGDTLISVLVGDREDAVPVELVPVN